ncbi:MAG: hypothetical protein GXP45_01230 [bacterium]|nr:hypothetical protein [bacterium]
MEFNAVKHEIVEDINNRNFTSYDKTRPQRIPGKVILTKNWEFEKSTRVQNTK